MTLKQSTKQSHKFPENKKGSFERESYVTVFQVSCHGTEHSVDSGCALCAVGFGR